MVNTIVIVYLKYPFFAILKMIKDTSTETTFLYTVPTAKCSLKTSKETHVMENREKLEK